VYDATAAAWESLGTLAGPAGPAGATGATGATGADGADGADGQTILNGNGAPVDNVTGTDGDFYIDTSAHTIYGPRTAGAWGSPTSLVAGGATTLGGLTDVDLTTSPPTNGEALVYDSVNSEWVPGSAGATAAGSANQVQYNDGAGGLAASADLTWDNTAKELGVGGDLNLDDGGTFSTTVQSVTPTANRTISFPDATGTVALVSGADGTIQYNDAGTLKGNSDFTVDPDWNDASTVFTGLKLNVTNTASAGDSNLLDLQAGGTSYFFAKADGKFGTSTAWLTSSSTGVFKVGSATSDGRGIIGLRTIVGSSGFFAFSDTNVITDESDYDLALFRDAANTLAQRNGTAAQTFRLYNTYNSPTDYARGYFTFSGQELQIGTEKQTQVAAQAIRLKTATQTEPIYLAPGGFNFFSVDSVSQVRTGLPINMAAAYTFATLPAGAVGYITRITDGDASLTPGTVLSGANTGNGTNTPYLCWYNGTNWTVIGA
jgi:hypothetical protein